MLFFRLVLLVFSVTPIVLSLMWDDWLKFSGKKFPWRVMKVFYLPTDALYISLRKH
jgi:hypothetical protein